MSPIPQKLQSQVHNFIYYDLLHLAKSGLKNWADGSTGTSTVFRNPLTREGNMTVTKQLRQYSFWHNFNTIVLATKLYAAEVIEYDLKDFYTFAGLNDQNGADFKSLQMDPDGYSTLLMQP